MITTGMPMPRMLVNVITAPDPAYTANAPSGKETINANNNAINEYQNFKLREVIFDFKKNFIVFIFIRYCFFANMDSKFMANEIQVKILFNQANTVITRRLSCSLNMVKKHFQ